MLRDKLSRLLRLGCPDQEARPLSPIGLELLEIGDDDGLGSRSDTITTYHICAVKILIEKGAEIEVQGGASPGMRVGVQTITGSGAEALRDTNYYD